MTFSFSFYGLKPLGTLTFLLSFYFLIYLNSHAQWPLLISIMNEPGACDRV